MTEGPASLRAALETVADGLDGVQRAELPDGLELRRAGHPFARLREDGAAFRLDRVIAAAALRTPDVSNSSLGPDWVSFTPSAVDRFALDRASAWLQAAWRRAAPSART